MYRSGLIELEAALAVARLKGFRPAARELGMSTSALSNAVAGLEQRLGVRLFNRTTRSVALTEAGEAFVAQVAPALASIRYAMEAAGQSQQAPAGTLRLNCSLGAAKMILRPLVLEYLRQYPRMKAEIETEDRLVDIVAEGFDAGIRLMELVPQDMVRVPIGEPLRMAVVGSPDYFSRHPRPAMPAELSGHVCIGGRKAERWQFVRHGETVNVEVSGPLLLDDPGLMVDAACTGEGLAMVAEYHALDDLASGKLVRVLEDWTPAFSRLALYYPSGRLVPPGLRAFIDLVKAEWQ